MTEGNGVIDSEVAAMLLGISKTNLRQLVFRKQLVPTGRQKRGTLFPTHSTVSAKPVDFSRGHQKPAMQLPRWPRFAERILQGLIIPFIPLNTILHTSRALITSPLSKVSQQVSHSTDQEISCLAWPHDVKALGSTYSTR